MPLRQEDLDERIEQWFAEAGVGEFFDIAEISRAQVELALNRNFSLINQVDRDMSAVIGQTIARAIATKSSPADLKKELIRLNTQGDLELTALEITDKNGVKRVIGLETRLNTIARTELFKTEEDTKIQTSEELLDDPVGTAKTARDKSVRPRHKAWQGWTMKLSDWMKAPDRPGQLPNCRCTLIIDETSEFKGTLHKTLPGG